MWIDFQRSTHRAHQGKDKARPHASSGISDWQCKSCGCSLPGRVMGQGQVSLGHAYGKVVKAL